MAGQSIGSAPIVQFGIRCFVIHTDHRQEQLARASVRALGFETYLPEREVTVSHARKREIMLRPIFPGYLFVWFDESEKTYGPIKSARGVNYHTPILCNGSGLPQHVPEAVIDGIKQREQMLKANTGEVTTGYQPGDRLTLAVGRYASFDAEYMGEEKGYATVIVTLFGRPFVEKVPVSALPPLENHC